MDDSLARLLYRAPEGPSDPYDPDDLAAQPVSPELALVDPRLGAYLRARLPTPIRDDLIDGRSRVGPSAYQTPAQAEPQRQADAEHRKPAVRHEFPRAEPLRHRVAPAVGVRRVRWRLWVIVGLTAGCATFVVWSGAVNIADPVSGLMPGEHQAGGPSQSAAPRAQGPRVPEPVSSAPAVNPPPRFVWPVVDGAVGYQVEVFDQKVLVLRRRVEKASFLLPTTWGFSTRRHRLHVGAYRWVVRPLVTRLDGTLSPGRVLVDARYQVEARHSAAGD